MPYTGISANHKKTRLSTINLLNVFFPMKSINKVVDQLSTSISRRLLVKFNLRLETHGMVASFIRKQILTRTSVTLQCRNQDSNSEATSSVYGIIPLHT